MQALLPWRRGAHGTVTGHASDRQRRPAGPGQAHTRPAAARTRAPPRRACGDERRIAPASPAAARPARHGGRVPRRVEALWARRRRLGARDVRRAPSGDGLPRRPDGLGQVDDHAPADQGARADRRAHPRGRARSVGDRAQEGALLPSQRRRRLPGLQAAADAHGVRQHRLRAAGDGHLAQADSRDAARHPAPDGALDEAAQLPAPALRRRAAARGGGARVRGPPAAAAWRTSRRATSTRRHRSGSCSCSTGSTAPARR